VVLSAFTPFYKHLIFPLSYGVFVGERLFYLLHFTACRRSCTKMTQIVASLDVFHTMKWRRLRGKVTQIISRFHSCWLVIW